MTKPLLFFNSSYTYIHYSAAWDWLIANAVSVRFRRVVTNRNFVEISNAHVNCQLEAQASPSWNETYGPAPVDLASVFVTASVGLILLCIFAHSEIKSPIFAQLWLSSDFYNRTDNWSPISCNWINLDQSHRKVTSFITGYRIDSSI